MFVTQFSNPGLKDGKRVTDRRHEIGAECLAELGGNHAGILLHIPFDNIDMLQLERRQRANARGGERGESDQCAIPPLQDRVGGHGGKDMMHLLQ